MKKGRTQIDPYRGFAGRSILQRAADENKPTGISVLPGRVEDPSPKGIIARLSEIATGFYSLMKRYSVGELDQEVDFMATSDYPGTHAGSPPFPVALLTYRVPQGQSLVIQQFCFFIRVNNAPANPVQEWILANPLEYSRNVIFRILINGASPILNRSSFNTGVIPFGGVVPRLDGFTILTQDPAQFHPEQCINVVAPPNSKVEVVAYQIGAWGVPQRQPLDLGFRLRGFLTPELRK